MAWVCPLAAEGARLGTENLIESGQGYSGSLFCTDVDSDGDIDLLLVKDTKNKRLYNSVPKYMITTTENRIDVKATSTATVKAYKEGRLSFDEFQVEINRLKGLLNIREEI